MTLNVYSQAVLPSTFICYIHKMNYDEIIKLLSFSIAVITVYKGLVYVYGKAVSAPIKETEKFLLKEIAATKDKISTEISISNTDINNKISRQNKEIKEEFLKLMVDHIDVKLSNNNKVMVDRMEIIFEQMKDAIVQFKESIHREIDYVSKETDKLGQDVRKFIGRQ